MTRGLFVEVVGINLSEKSNASLNHRKLLDLDIPDIYTILELPVV